MSSEFNEMPKSSHCGFCQVEASFRQIFQYRLSACYEDEVEIGQVTPWERAVALNKEQAVACNVIGTQRTFLSRCLTLLMIDGAGRLVPDGIASTLNHHRPVEFFIIEEETGRHHASLFNDLTSHHHCGTMGIGRRMSCVILSVVQFVETYCVVT